MKNSILEVDLTDGQFAALANQTRRAILGAVYEAPMSPREIAEQIGGNMVSVKRHLQILLACDLVLQSQRGNVREYRANHEVLSLCDKSASI